MKIGIVYEDFHSEVLEFILEILQFELDTNIIVYNDKDKYDNIDSYQKNYNRIQRRSLGMFIKDLNNDVCDKFIIVSYTNLLNLAIMQEFKNKLIFIAHDDNQVKQLKTNQMNYIVLSKLLSKEMDEKWKYMLPISKNSKIENNFSDIKEVESKEQIEKRNNFIKENGLKPIMIIGHFFENNKDIKLINKFLSTKKIFLFVFAPNLTKELAEMVKPYPEYTLCGIGCSTKMIERFIQQYDINYVLFPPPKDSKFFKSQWSGSMAFGINRDMTVIMPEELAKEYMIEDGVTIYNNENDITEEFMDNLNKKETKDVRNKIYKRNSMIMELLLTNKYKEYKMKNGYLYKENDDIGLDNTEQIAEDVIDNTKIYIISPKTPKIAIDIIEKKDNCKVYLFNKEIEKCLEYKNTVLLYNYQDKVKIFNEELVKDITLDTFDEKVDKIIKEGDDINEIKIAKNTLNKFKPNIVLIKEVKKDEKELIEIEGYMYKTKDLVNTNLDKFEVTEWINITKQS